MKSGDWRLRSQLGGKRILYACRTLGVPDHDRCNRLAVRAGSVLCLVWPLNKDYIWDIPTPARFDSCQISLGPGTLVARAAGVARLWRSALRFRPDVVLIYGYQDPVLFGLALLHRLTGRVVLSLNDSKFDDYDRSLWREALKSVFLVPYHGILAASPRAAEYVRFLGKKRTELYRCAIDIERVRAGAAATFQETRFEDRHFVMLARFVRKKNHLALLDMYEAYLARSESPRMLKLVGYGELEGDIAARIASSALLSRYVSVAGYRDAAEIPRILGASLALLLPSLEEQFGIVATEALASGVPAIISPACGSAGLVQDFVNGFVIDPGNTEGWIRALELMSSQTDWTRMSAMCVSSAGMADTGVFEAAVARLIGTVTGKPEQPVEAERPSGGDRRTGHPAGHLQR